MKITRHLFILSATVIIAFSGCKEEVEPLQDTRDTFLKTFSNTSAEFTSSMIPLDDGGLILLSSDYYKHFNNYLNVRQVNKHGNVVWEKQISIDYISYPMGVQLDDGSILINNRRNPSLIRMDLEGNIIYNTEIWDRWQNNNIYSPIVLGDDGLCHISMCDGMFHGGSSNSYVFAIDPEDGQYVSGWTFPDGFIGGKNLQIMVSKVENGEMYFVGNAFYKWWPSWSWSDLVEPYFLYIRDTSETRFRPLYNAYEDSTQNHFIASQTALMDGGMALVMGHGTVDINTPASENRDFKVMKVNDRFETVWNNDINLGTVVSLVSTIHESSDGSLLICGYVEGKGQLDVRPFIVKLNSSGDVVLKKILELQPISVALDAYQDIDGNIFVSGSTSAFGKSRDNFNSYLLKTTPAGEFE